MLIYIFAILKRMEKISYYFLEAYQFFVHTKFEINKKILYNKNKCCRVFFYCFYRFVINVGFTVLKMRLKANKKAKSCQTQDFAFKIQLFISDF